MYDALDLPAGTDKSKGSPFLEILWLILLICEKPGS